MPNKKQWQDIIDKSWFYMKCFLAILLISTLSYFYGTFHPNQVAISKIGNNLDNYYVNKIKAMDLKEPEFTYNNDIQFIRAMHKCIDYVNFTTPKHLRVPYEMIIGQAALESGWGTSRFSTQGNNLFGIRTWKENLPHLLPVGIKKWPGWGVKVFASKCDSVKYYITMLNQHSAYKEFRELRQSFLDKNLQLDSKKMIKKLDKFSTTADYDKRVIRVIDEIRELEDKK